MASAFMHGWVSLPTQGEMYLEHGVPRHVRVETEGKLAADVERLVDEIYDVAGLHVTIDRWQPAEDMSEMQAGVHVDAADIEEVMRRLAQASAEIFYDRFHKPIQAGDTDFDEEAYAQDFNTALDICGLRWGQADTAALRDAYRRALHRAADAIAH